MVNAHEIIPALARKQAEGIARALKGLGLVPKYRVRSDFRRKAIILEGPLVREQSFRGEGETLEIAAVVSYGGVAFSWEDHSNWPALYAHVLAHVDENENWILRATTLVREDNGPLRRAGYLEAIP